jgi:hypothetical protein
VDRHSGFLEPRTQFLEESLGDGSIHEEGLESVADSGTLGLRVEADVDRLADLGALFDEEMTDTLVMLDDGNA